jgi:hypothetical protein
MEINELPGICLILFRDSWTREQALISDDLIETSNKIGGCRYFSDGVFARPGAGFLITVGVATKEQMTFNHGVEGSSPSALTM